MNSPRPLPDVNTPSTAPFWSGLRDHQLLMQKCPACHELRYPAATVCPECLTFGGEWVEVPARGELWSYIVYHRDLSGAFGDDIPLTIGVVELENGMHVLARVDTPGQHAAIGTTMKATFDEITDDVTLLRWSPIQDPAAVHD